MSKKLLAMIIALYKYGEDKTKELYKEQRDNRDELLKMLALLLLTYEIIDDKVNIPSKDKAPIIAFITKCAKSQCTHEEKILTDILKNVVNNTWDYYNYNHKQKDVLELINKQFKGKSFSNRVWDNGEEIAKELEKKINRFCNGEINVSKIKSEINKTYNKGAYNTNRLVNTEIARVHNEAFVRFCKETNVNKIKYNATLDINTCGDCESMNGNIYEFNNVPSIPRHPNCKCYYEIVE